MVRYYNRLYDDYVLQYNYCYAVPHSVTTAVQTLQSHKEKTGTEDGE